MNILKILITIIVAFVLFNFLSLSSFAISTTDILKASVKISVCGNGVVEGGEDCERDVLITKTCKDFGFQGGILECDNSCSYDLLNCNYLKEIYMNEYINEDPIIVEDKKIRDIFNIPFLIKSWDKNNDGILDKNELKNFISQWVAFWKIYRVSDDTHKEDVKNNCDVNGDGTCNVKDFSIILYHTYND